MQFGSDPPPARLIPLTPLIDVVFILLVFFMLASSFLDWRALDLKVAARSGGGESAGNTLLVTLKADGALQLNGQAVPPQALMAGVRAAMAREPAPAVLLRPEPSVPLQRVIDTIDLLERAGAVDVALSRGGAP